VLKPVLTASSHQGENCFSSFHYVLLAILIALL
jgi:hypothetical protein